jgi:O-antigen ligase
MLKEYLYGLFVLIVTFSYSVFFIARVALGISEQGIIFRVYSAILTIVTLFFYILNLHKMPRGSNLRVIFVISLVVFLFFCTRLFYFYPNDRYQAYFLSMGVRFIPSVLIAGIIFTDDKWLQRIEKALLPFMVFYSIVVSSLVLSVDLSHLNSNMLIYNNAGLNYQNLSYFSIYAYGMALYLLSNRKFKWDWVKYGLIALAFLQLYTAFSAGGRGAFVLAIIFTLYWGTKYLMNRSFIGIYLILLLSVIVFLFMFSNNYRFEYGFSRIANFFTDYDSLVNDGRWIRWRLAWDAFSESPIYGHGLGSVFYEVGFYSHNIIMDILCEGGILLLSIFGIITLKFIYSLHNLIKQNEQNRLMMLFLLSSLVFLCFSGYYLSETAIWVALTYTLLKYDYA